MDERQKSLEREQIRMTKQVDDMNRKISDMASDLYQATGGKHPMFDQGNRPEDDLENT